MGEERNKFTIHQLFWYFTLFSILGLIIETIYGYATMGILESRKGLLWGPFCPVYGVGAIVLIILLNNIDQKNNIKLFIYGVLIGSIVEYILSYGLEAIYSSRFWDYSYTNYNINGRICVTYSIFWGILSILIIRVIKPIMDKFINKINIKVKLPIELSIFLFLVVDTLVTVWAVYTYETRAINEYYGEEVKHSNISWIRKVEEEYFTNGRMKNVFPNLRTKDKEGNQVFVRDILVK